MRYIYFNEEWNKENEKQEHNIGSISDYYPCPNTPTRNKKRDYFSDLYFFE